MKKYSVYQKSESVYFGPELAFPIALAIITSAITYVFLYFLGIVIAILFNAVISWCAYYYIYYYGKSETRITFNFIKGFALILALVLFVDYGVYALVTYQKTGIFKKLFFQIWLIAILGVPVLFYTSYFIIEYCHRYFSEKKMADYFLKVLLDIDYDRELLTYIDNVQFINTSKKVTSDIKLEKIPCFYSDQELEEMESDRIRNYFLEKSYYSEMTQLPFGTNLLKISWFSLIEDKYYDLELPFPFDKISIEKQKYPAKSAGFLRGKKTKPLTLHIHSNGGVRLFNNDTVLINHLKSTPAPISTEERNHKIKQHQYSHEYYNDCEKFSRLIEKIKTSGGIEERFLIQNTKLPWRMSFSELDDNNYFEVTDVSFTEYKIEKKDFEEPVLRFLPKKIQAIYRGYHLCRWLTIRINTQKLYHTIKNSIDENEECAISFDLSFQNYSKTDLKFTITANEKSMVFTDWEFEIDASRKQSMDKHLFDTEKAQMEKSGILSEIKISK